MVIEDIFTLGVKVIGLVTPKEPTPEEQKQKAGVWYNMLQDWVNNQPQDSNSFGAKWKDFLPFKQSKTKSNFINNNINGKSYDAIVNTLCDKINDELVEGKFPRMSNSAILAGMGSSGGLLSNPSGSTVVGKTDGGFVGTVGEVEESKTFFYVVGLGGIAVLLLVYAFGGFGKKRKK